MSGGSLGFVLLFFHRLKRARRNHIPAHVLTRRTPASITPTFSLSFKMRAMLILAVASLTLVMRADAGVVNLTGSTFDAEVFSGKGAFIKFFAPWRVTIPVLFLDIAPLDRHVTSLTSRLLHTDAMKYPPPIRVALEKPKFNLQASADDFFYIFYFLPQPHALIHSFTSKPKFNLQPDPI